MRISDWSSDVCSSDLKLRRLLRAEGANLATIRENVRRDKAVRLLTATHATVEAIAAALGHAEARSFTRAFRHWTGCSPSAWTAGAVSRGRPRSSSRRSRRERPRQRPRTRYGARVGRKGSERECE